jgi:hypothetical protein
VARAREALRTKGRGSIHITDPAAELFQRYGFDPSVAIYKHFEGGGAEGGLRSYWCLGESSNEERVGVTYAPDQDAVVIWRWGEAESDPDAAVLAEHDEGLAGSSTAVDEGAHELLQGIDEGYRTSIDLAMLSPTVRAVAVMRSEGVDPSTLGDSYQQLDRELGEKHLVVWDAYDDGEVEVCAYRYDDEDRTRVWLRDEFDATEEPRPLYRAGHLGGL